MSATTVLSDILTNRANSVINPKGTVDAMYKKTVAHMAIAGALEADSVIVMHAVHIDAVIPSIKYAADDVGTGGNFDLGLYPGNIEPASLVVADAVDQDFFASALDFETAAVGLTEARNEAAAGSIDKLHKPIWQAAGVSTRPTTYSHFWIAFTVTEANTAAGDVVLVTEHSL